MSNTPKFTPGPWRLVGKPKGHNLACWIFGKDPTPDANRELQVISILDSHVDKGHLERRYADMKLVAAAPELYQMLKDLYDRKALPQAYQIAFEELQKKINQ